MDNFDLKKYITEGRIYEEEEPIIHAKEYYQSKEGLKNLEDEGFDDIIDFIKTTYTGKMRASEFLKTWPKFMEIGGVEGGDIDLLVQMLKFHIDKGYMTVDDAMKVMEMNMGRDLSDDKVIIKMLTKEGRILKEEVKDVEDILVKAGFNFNDGILGGVGSGGAGYYDPANDAIYGIDQSGPWNEEEFNKFYDNFSFNSTLYTSEDFEDMEIDRDAIKLNDGIYFIGNDGYVKINSNGDIEIYAVPQLSDDIKFLPAFKMDGSGKAIPQFSKDEMRKLLKDDMYYIY